MYKIKIYYKETLIAVWGIRAKNKMEAMIRLEEIIGSGYILKQGSGK